MSILIKDMEMPINCENCRFWYQDQDSEHNIWNRCTALNHKEIVPFIVERREDCPLIEVPISHGRLIDANNLIKNIHNDWDEVLVWDESGEATANEFERLVDVQPTIIETEKGESNEHTD